MSKLAEYADWVRCLALTAGFRCRAEVVRYRRPYVDLYAVDCSREETAQLLQMDEAVLTDLANQIRDLVASSKRIPRVRAFCLGRNAPLSLAPREVRPYLPTRDFGGFWIHNLRMVIAASNEALALGEVVAHELTHGLLDCLTDDFPYPYALTEGFARTIGRSTWLRVSCLNSNDDGRAPERKMALVTDTYYLSIEQLLSFGMRGSLLEDREMVLRVSELSALLNGYIWRLGTRRRRVRRVLAELWTKDIWSPIAVHEWLQEASGMDAEALEEGFREYCTRGALPRA